MGWFGLHQAILGRDVDCLAVELSTRQNPNDPESALLLAIREMSEPQRHAALEWADAWLRDPANDVLRARGDPRWGAVCSVERWLRAMLAKRIGITLRDETK